MIMSESVLAIVGGGRWGQVILSILAPMAIPFSKLVIVSRANAEEVNKQIKELNLISHLPIEISPTIDDLLSLYQVKAAVIVNAAGQHFETARRLMSHGIHVLIEKPIVALMQQMQILIEDARQNNVVLVPGLNYRFCTYIRNFALEVKKKGKPTQFFLKWSDAYNEMRYGRSKKYDASISVIEDVMPHVWTILSIIFQDSKIHIQSCSQDNIKAALKVSINQIPGEIELQRDGEKRQRFLALQYESDVLELDFTFEPGTITVNKITMTADADWGKKSTPLTRQLEYFFSTISKGKTTSEDIQDCLSCVHCTEVAANFH